MASCPSHQDQRCIFLLGLLGLLFATPVRGQMNEIPHDEVHNWASKFGPHLFELSKKITNFAYINTSYSSASLEKVNATKTVQDMVADIESMLQWKVQAVERIIETAQQSMKGHEFEPHPDFQYFNAKEINNGKEGLKMILNENKRFNNIPVNTSHSTIHVATNVYNKDVLVLNAIKGTEFLNPTFVKNFQLDPTSSWQYFGSVTGFLRNFPGVKWLVDEGDTDIYDCRMRPWYIEAAASPKDLVIILDTSGSMTGLRQEIAKQVVSTLLDTLNANDFVAVLQFNDSVKSVVDCFDNMLVPANRENIEEFKENLNELKTEKVANFTFALINAFELLRMYNESGEGSQCNQAIMIVTDGSPDTYDDLFNHYNQPHRFVRIFTYLIGREVTEIREVQYMACAHRGYFTHVKTPAEVREQVEKYIPVMSRPMVIQMKHNFIWTPVYADIAEFRYCEVPKHYQLMTTVAAPVFDLDRTVKIKERILVNGTSVERTREEKKANLLGVAGTDIPIKEILKLVPPYKIGVNGYAFIITNNGHLLCHPDLRPMFGDLLKPDYSTVDLSEVELHNSSLDPWEKDPQVMKLRKEMIDRVTGDTVFNVKTHYDKMKRVIARRNHYFYAPIKKTPFSFGIALPKGYGEFKIKAEEDFKKHITEILNDFQTNNKWRVHPDWVYCAYHFPGNRPELTPEENLLHFLNLFQKDPKDPKLYQERRQRVKPPLSDDLTEKNFKNRDKNEYYCDLELIHNLIIDAKLTIKHGKGDSMPVNTDSNNAGLARKNGVTISFVATRSGLTRWHDLVSEDEIGNRTEPHFSQIHNRAIDEIWYKRAVDQFYINNDSFIFSVPFDAVLQNDTYVTGSRAIFVEGLNAQVPVAVVGLQFKHSAFAENFFNYTSNCASKNCPTNCSSDDLNCYLLDDNGFVIVSKKYQDTGKFFGEVDGLIMQSLIVDGIYNGVRLYDFQGVCQESVSTSNAAAYILKPIQQVASTILWLWQKIALLWLQYNLYNWWNSDWLTFAAANDDSNPLVRHIEENEMFKMKYRPCNKNFTLYRLDPTKLQLKPLKAKLMKCNPNGCDSLLQDFAEMKNNFSFPRPFSVQQVPQTNLVMVIVDGTCSCESSQITSISATEIKYDNVSRCEMMKNMLYRRRPTECFNYDEEELQIKDCGRGATLRISMTGLLISILLTVNAFKAIHPWS